MAKDQGYVIFSQVPKYQNDTNAMEWKENERAYIHVYLHS